MHRPICNTITEVALNAQNLGSAGITVDLKSVSKAKGGQDKAYDLSKNFLFSMRLPCQTLMRRCQMIHLAQATTLYM